jgi:hypothetical protein
MFFWLSLAWGLGIPVMLFIGSDIARRMNRARTAKLLEYGAMLWPS